MSSGFSKPLIATIAGNIILRLSTQQDIQSGLSKSQEQHDAFQVRKHSRDGGARTEKRVGHFGARTDPLCTRSVEWLAICVGQVKVDVQTNMSDDALIPR